MGAPYQVTIDSGAAGLIASGNIDVIVTGADRIAANGDVANKVGTYTLALAARANGVPFIVAAPSSTIDLETSDGDAIPIEIRSASEVLEVNGAWVAPEDTEAYNPAFDVTSASLISAIVTEFGIVRPGVDDLRVLIELREADLEPAELPILSAYAEPKVRGPSLSFRPTLHR